MASSQPVVLDIDGNEVGRGTTSPQSNAIQLLSLDVAELGPDEEYTIEIVTGPDGWEACRGETSQTIGEAEIGPAGSGRLVPVIQRNRHVNRARRLC